MKTIVYTSLFAISLFLFASCEKESLGVSLDDMLTTGTWTSKHELVNGAVSYVYEEGYEDSYTFKKDGTYDGLSPISYLPEQAGTWSINPLDSVISFQTVFENGDGYDYTRKMKKLTNNVFILEQRYLDNNSNRWISLQTVFEH